MKARIPVIALLAACFTLAGCSSGAEEDTQGAQGQEGPDIPTIIQTVQVPAEHQPGMTAFNANCASCHGERGLGTEQGPPLIHIIYEPSHHADIAFLMAAQRGVRAHHWQFGDMPPLPDVQHEEVLSIIAYIRFLQQQVGIV